MGVIVTLVLEVLLIAMLLFLGRAPQPDRQGGTTITTFDVGEPPQQPKAEAEPETPTFAAPAPTTPQTDTPPPAPLPPRALSANPVPVPPRPPVIQISPDDYRSADISNLPRRRPDAPSGPAYGPPAPSGSGNDSQVVGTAPDGSPLYAARWFREPNDQEMAGYLSTAEPDSWALIACKTAPDWRVEDCVGVQEYPSGSNLMRAVLAAAWTFQVRPPRRGDMSLVGSWVRIRIDYTRRVAR